MAEQSPPSRELPAAIILNDTRVDRHHGCSSVMRTLEAGLATAGFRIAATVPAHSDWAQDAGFQAALPSAQLLVINGEGTLHHDRPAGLRLLQAGRHAREHGLATALVNAGWEANGAAYGDAVRGFDLVSARDSRSAEALRAVGIDCRVVPDLSLCSPAPPEPARRAGIACTDSVDPDVTLALDALRRAAAADVLSIHDFDPARDPSWGFLRAVVGRRDLAHPARALALLRARRAQWRSSAPGTDAFLRRIAGYELLVSGRFHACTLALVAGTPFVAAGTNSHKIHALIEDSGVAAWRGRAQLSPDGLREAARQGWSPDEKAAVARFVCQARDGAAELFRDIGTLAA
jgi:hypothetical protein